MASRPPLHLYVTPGCPVCDRAQRTLRSCARLATLAELVVLELGAPDVKPPPAVIGGPTTVFDGAVVALGTPDCAELVRRLESLLGRER